MSHAITIFLALLATVGCGGTVDSDRPPEDGDGGPPDAGMPDAGPTMACPEESIVETSGLLFDGVDDHVAMGAAPALGLAELTVEAWIRRDGAGVAAGTGVGGLALVPIAGKGRGEGDGSNIDCNYAFGLFGEVLGADFEDMATGANHPVIGRTRIARGEWHHVAATYDGTTWRLYLDGVLDGEATAMAMPRADSIQHFGIGAAFDSMGVPAGAFHGAIDEVRVWDRARTQTELDAARFQTLAADTGLVGRWAFDALDAAAPDSVGMNDGTVTGATFTTPGAVTGLGLPPRVDVVAPADGAMITGDRVDLALAIEDDRSDLFEVVVYVREITADDDFTIAVMPDTQHYTEEGRGLEHHFEGQTEWIVANREAYGIVAVIHNGDIVQNGDRYPYQWMVADRAMSTLEVPTGDLPDGLPYSIAVGNHDQTPIGTTGNTLSYNRWFGIDRFAGRAYYGGHYADDNDENWVTFNAGGLDFVVVTTQYDLTADPAVLNWARRIFESHPDAFGVFNSHFLVTLAGNFGAQGLATYNRLRDLEQVRLFTCGHVAGESRRVDEFEGHRIHSMLADYQGREMGGNGWMRLWEFSPANGELTVRTYSPSLDRWETDANSEFTIPVDLSGAGGAFRELAAFDPARTDVTATWSGLEPATIYEWYATVSDCAHTVTTPVQRFTTAAAL